MTINKTRFDELATKGEVAGVAISTVIALNRISSALRNIATGDTDITEYLERIKSEITDLDMMFDVLTEWKPEDGS